MAGSQIAGHKMPGEGATPKGCLQAQHDSDWAMALTFPQRQRVVCAQQSERSLSRPLLCPRRSHCTEPCLPALPPAPVPAPARAALPALPTRGSTSTPQPSRFGRLAADVSAHTQSPANGPGESPSAVAPGAAKPPLWQSYDTPPDRLPFLLREANRRPNRYGYHPLGLEWDLWLDPDVPSSGVGKAGEEQGGGRVAIRPQRTGLLIWQLGTGCGCPPVANGGHGCSSGYSGCRLWHYVLHLRLARQPYAVWAAVPL